MNRFLCYLLFSFCLCGFVMMTHPDEVIEDEDVKTLCKRTHGVDSKPALDGQCIYVCENATGGQNYENKRNGFKCGEGKKCLAAQCYSSYLVDACMERYPSGGDNLAILMGDDGCTAQCSEMDKSSSALLVKDGEPCFSEAAGSCVSRKCLPDPQSGDEPEETPDLVMDDPDDEDVKTLCKRTHGPASNPVQDGKCIYVCENATGGQYYENKRNGFKCGKDKKCLAAQCYSSYLVDACMERYPRGGDNLAILMGEDGCTAQCSEMDKSSSALLVQDGEPCFSAAAGSCVNRKCVPATGTPGGIVP